MFILLSTQYMLSGYTDAGSRVRNEAGNVIEISKQDGRPVRY